jgi:hypothetical protein
MEKIKKDTLKNLIEKKDGYNISIYMPTQKSTTRAVENKTRFKTLLSKAEEKMKELQMDKKKVENLLKPAEDLLNKVSQWEASNDGIAAFISDDFLKLYRLPQPVEETVTVDKHFYVKPLIPFTTDDTGYYLLSINLSGVNLYKCSRYSIEKVDLEDVPENIEEIAKFDQDEEHLQYHGQEQKGKPYKKNSVMYHGQGVGKDEDMHKNQITQYLRLVSNGVHKALQNENSPMVLAGIEYLHPMYKDVSSYSHIYDKGVKKNPENMSKEELRESSWEVVKPHFNKVREDALNKYNDLSATDKTSDDLIEVAQKAYQGRVESLFIPNNKEQWCLLNKDGMIIELSDEWKPNLTSIYNYATIHTYGNGGRVFLMEQEDMPNGKDIAAVFR